VRFATTWVPPSTINNNNNAVHIHQQLTEENIHPQSHQTINHIPAHLLFLYLHPLLHPLFCFHRKFETTTYTSNVNTSAKTTAKANENKTQNSDK
jgi:hypothetical protein